MRLCTQAELAGGICCLAGTCGLDTLAARATREGKSVLRTARAAAWTSTVMLDDAVVDGDSGSFGEGSQDVLEVRIVLSAESSPQIVTPNFNGTTVPSEPLLEFEVVTGVPVGVRRRMGPRFAFVNT